MVIFFLSIFTFRVNFIDRFNILIDKIDIALFFFYEFFYFIYLQSQENRKKIFTNPELAKNRAILKSKAKKFEFNKNSSNRGRSKKPSAPMRALLGAIDDDSPKIDKYLTPTNKTKMYAIQEDMIELGKPMQSKVAKMEKAKELAQNRQSNRYSPSTVQRLCEEPTRGGKMLQKTLVDSKSLGSPGPSRSSNSPTNPPKLSYFSNNLEFNVPPDVRRPKEEINFDLMDYT